MYSRERVAVTLQPRGARPKVPTITVTIDANTSKKPPPRRARALPAVPPTTEHSIVSSTQNTRCIRPLPYCPSLNTESSQLQASSSASSSSLSSPSSSSPLSSSPTLSIPSPSAPIHSTPPSPTLFSSSIALADEDDSLSDIGPIEFERSHFNSDRICEDGDDDEDTDIMEPFQHIKNNKSANHRWKTDWRLPTQAQVPTQKWVTETKGQRMTVKDFDNVRDILRTL